MRRSTTRRDFLLHSVGLAATAAGVAANSSLAKAREQSQPGPRPNPPGKNPWPIIDTHQHLWDLEQFRLPWITRDSPLRRNYVLNDYREATRGLNVIKAVYMEVDVDPEQQGAEADWITAICRRGNTVTRAAVVSGRPASEGFAQYLRRFRGNPHIKGIRQVLHGGNPRGYCVSREFIRGIRLLGEAGLSFDLCMRPTELGDGLRLVQECRDTRFILDHCGNGNVQATAEERTSWQRSMERLGRCPNVVCKVSGIVASARNDRWGVEDLAPLVDHTLDSFGPDRVMFGGDWPVCTLRSSYRRWVEALREIVRLRPGVQQRKLFHDNAARYYNI